MLLQVLEDGHITDAHGKKVDFKNTIIIMTSNAGANRIISPKTLGFGQAKTSEEEYQKMKEGVMEEVKHIFKPEFINRVDEMIVFHALNKENIKDITMDEEEKLDALRQDFFSYYRRMRSNLFSDTEIVYETRLTTEVFDLKLQQLSQDKKQSEFENFAIAVASRLITPNIKPQTGPDGGGDGKVDGETYPVDKAISDKWWISEGSTGDQKWAIAISVQKSWQSKVEADVKKAVETKRGYTKLLYFTNQKIKSSSRQAKEDELAQQYGISVSIFDGKWFSFAVFEQGCLDIAIEKLNFSDEYRKKTIKIGPNDKERKSELNKIEDDLIKHTVADLDTDYVNDLLKTCILSRGLEKPRMETEGRFNRALREAKVHGTSIQIFNIIYNHAWTSFFWFHDVEATYSDYLKLKDYTKEHPTVHTIERLTNILTNLENVISLGLFDTSKFAIEVQFIKELRQCSKLSQPCQLFLDLYISEHRLFQLINRNEDLTDELQTLTSLIEQCANYLDISFSAQSRIVELLGRVISDNPEFERLVDMIADISSKRESEVQGAMTHFTRANALMEKGNYVSAIKHLGHCVQSFLKEGCEEEYVKSCGNMGMALYHLELPYSAEAYLVKTASFLVRDFYEHGAIPHLLITVLSTLCEIELMLGRLVMYLNWRELLFIISRNGQEFESELFLERDTIADGGWACRFAMADTGNPEFSILPDILDRCDMPLSTNYLKYALGYTDEVDEHFAELITAGNWQDLLLKQPIHEQFWGQLSIATDETTTLSTLANNCRFYVTYDNSIQNQLVAETFLASVETMLATFANIELVILQPKIQIHIKETKEDSSLCKGDTNTEYIFYVNHETLTDLVYWNCFVYFIGFFMSYNTVSKDDVKKLLEERQKSEKIMDRVSSLMQLNRSVYFVLGDNFKYSISKWQNANDKIYPCLITRPAVKPLKRHKSQQQNMSVYTISSNMQWWDNAQWSGVGFVFDRNMERPPVLAFLFKDVEEGKKIIHEWKSSIGQGKPDIEIQIIKGINKNHPTWYRVCVAPVVSEDDRYDGRYVGIMCRKHTMTPTDSKNLDAFEQIYPRFDKCCIVAALISDDAKQLLRSIDFNESIELKVIITDAWRVSAMDSTCNALEWDDDPIIPEEESKTAPVLALLENLREIQSKH